MQDTLTTLPDMFLDNMIIDTNTNNTFIKDADFPVSF